MVVCLWVAAVLMLTNASLTAAGPGGAQPHHCHRGAAPAHGLAADHRLLQRPRQHGDVAAQYGGRQQVGELTHAFFFSFCDRCKSVLPS